jgi:hypothetical protein
LAMAKRCKTGGGMRDYEHGSQKGGREAGDTFLPAEAGALGDGEGDRAGAQPESVVTALSGERDLLPIRDCL